MPVKLSVFSTAMRFGNSIYTPRAIPIFCRIFPFKIKYQGLFGNNRQLCVRALSSRPHRERIDSRPSENRSRDSGDRRVSKSLIDDEEELSNWVSDLRSDSFSGRSKNDNDDSGGGRSSGRGQGRSSEMQRRNGSEFGERTQWSSGRSESRDSYRGAGRFGREVDNDKGRSRGRPSSSRSDGKFFNQENRFGESSSRGRPSSTRDDGRRGSEARSTRSTLQNSRLSPRKEGFTTKKVIEEEEEEEEDDCEEQRKSLTDLISDESEGEDSDCDGDDEFMKKSVNSLFGDEHTENMPRTTIVKSDSYLSDTRFDEFSISPLSLKAIKDAGYEKMTVVQSATLPVILKGKDVLAKARTGTGKTVAFLLPSIEVIVKSPAPGRDQKRPPIVALVICPTRELATQAAAEATTLLKYHPAVGVQVVIGGTRLALEQKRMQTNPCQILVATPGRLRDHTENTPGFATRLMGVQVLVLDEADHLLDMGFRKDIEKIIAAVPKQRQTLLFSATVPDEVRQICHIALKRDHEFINTVQEGSEETHTQVRQMHLVASLDKHFPVLYSMLKDHIADDVNYKVLVFCTTAMMTSLVADLLRELKLNVREIHSRKSQGYRTRVSDEFRKSKGLILVTSDVSARGVDYPDVSLVVQVGQPSDREQYIHRLGRTGRKGKEGQGILLLAPWEESFLSSVKDLPMTKAPVPLVDPDLKKKVERALSHVEMKSKESAYQAWLGYYNSVKSIGKDKYKLVELANEFSRSMGLDTPPAISKLVLGKMGLKNIPGLRCK